MNTTTSTNCNFSVTNFKDIKDRVLNWANQFSTFCFLDNQQYNIQPHHAECILAAGVHRAVTASPSSLNAIQQLIAEEKIWLFGHLAYDLKDQLFQTTTAPKENRTGFEDIFFFEPQVLIRLNEKEISIESKQPDASAIYEQVVNAASNTPAIQKDVHIQQRLTKEQYTAVITQLQKHILRGDCYEINFCQEFYAENAEIDPLSIYKKLAAVSPNPFSAFYKTGGNYLLCASPERFLSKKDGILISQPIKGTAKRGQTPAADEEVKIALQKSLKERSENVMVVDLVRNDMSQVCKEGTVKAAELYGIYSFPQVHQMISTVQGELKQDVGFSDIIRATFPMGSMTGAPKKRVMELIGQYEVSRRGIFSGAVGYITPRGDFDFNVVIRSIMYNSSTRYLSFQAGSGITFYANAEQEWEECLLKAQAIQQILQ